MRWHDVGGEDDNTSIANCAGQPARFTSCLIISQALIFMAWLHELCAWPGCKLRAAVGWQHLLNDEAVFHGLFPRRSEELAVRADWLSSLLFCSSSYVLKFA